MKRRRILFDLETDGLLHTMTKIHLYVMKDLDTEEILVYKEHQGGEACRIVQNAQLLIGHNIINFDLNALKKIHKGFHPKGLIRDTLILSRLFFSNIKQTDFDLFRKDELPGKLIGRHSLKAWGYRLGQFKGQFGKTQQGDADPDVWAEWSQEMEDYAIQDVVVTDKLWNFLQSYRIKTSYSGEAISMQHQFADLMAQVEQNGFPFDQQAGKVLYSELSKRKEQILIEMQTVFRPWYQAKWVKGRKWEQAVTTTPVRTLNYKDPMKASRTQGAAYCQVILKQFNPGSRDMVADRLSRLFGWNPTQFTQTGKAKVNEDILKELSDEEQEQDELETAVNSIPEAKILAQYFTVTKRISQLATGKQAWLGLVRDGKIHGSVNTLGAVSRRVTHARPNMSQVPAVRSDYGVLMRGLFHVPKGWLQLGTDLSGIEIRCFANVLAEFDGGKYADIVLNGDVHSQNQKSFGVPTRDDAKTTLYALLYGAGLSKLGSIVGGSQEAGKRIKNNFMNSVPAYKQVVNKIKRHAERYNWIPALDGGRLHVRSPHSALNTSLQSAGALIAKRWSIQINNILQQEYDAVHSFDGDYAIMGFFHDQLQIAINVPQSLDITYIDQFDYSKVEGKDEEDVKKTIKKLQAKNKLKWYYETFPRVKIVADTTKEAIKRVQKHFNFVCPLDCEYIVGTNWAECH